MPIIEIFKTRQPKREMRASMQRRGRWPTTLKLSKSCSVQACSTRYKLASVTLLFKLKVRTVTFSSDSSRKWTSVWLVGENLDRAGSQPAHADEGLDLFQNINLIRRQQPPSSDSLIWWKSRIVQQDTRFYRTLFLLCLDETRPTCCR